MWAKTKVPTGHRAEESLLVWIPPSQTPGRMLLSYCCSDGYQPVWLKPDLPIWQGPWVLRTEMEMHQNDAPKSYGGTFIKWTLQQLHLLLSLSAREFILITRKNQYNIPVTSFLITIIFLHNFKIQKLKCLFLWQ